MSNSYEFMKEIDESVGVQEHKWYASDNQTDETSIHDRGKGEPVIIRHFEYKRDPTKTEKLTKEQILTPEYVKYLSVQLWADSLRLVLEPRVEITDDMIRVFAPCQARTGAVLTEEPKLLQEWLK